MAEVVQEAEWRRQSFAEWLRVMGPVYARLYLPYGRGGRYPPMREAILDLRAAMLWTEEQRDNAFDHWDWINKPDAVWERANGVLNTFGLEMPRHLFDAVWKLYAECEADPDPVWDDARAVWQTDKAGALNAAVWRLLWATTDALRYGRDKLSRKRYG